MGQLPLQAAHVFWLDPRRALLLGGGHLSPDDLIEELLSDEADSASVRSGGGSTPSAYQEELLSIDPLRERMPVLGQGQQTLRAELQAIADQTNDRAAFLRLAETLTAFLARLRSAAETLRVIERQKIVRLLVKEVLVGEDTITIRHSIPLPSGSPRQGGSEPADGQNYLLCKGREHSAKGQHDG
jgi:site-specific DNA recombinase